MKSRGAAFVLLVSFACAALCVAATRAQDSPPPKLDGYWTLNAAKSRIAKHGPPHSDTLRIESTAEFIIFYESIGGADVIRTYNSDGKISPVARVERRRRVMAKAYWKKGALWIETFGVESAPSALPGQRAESARAGKSRSRLRHQRTLRFSA